jgi:hypothetical protein
MWMSIQHARLFLPKVGMVHPDVDDEQRCQMWVENMGAQTKIKPELHARGKRENQPNGTQTDGINDMDGR